MTVSYCCFNTLSPRAYSRTLRSESFIPIIGNSTPARGRSSSGKPVYTRETIGQLYEAHRKGAYAGREQEWSRIEADIFAAQREGRVQGTPYLTK
jgi:hypothetical protein